MNKYFLSVIVLLSVCMTAIAQEVGTKNARTDVDRMLEKPMQSPLLADSLRWKTEMKLDNQLNSYTPQQNKTGGFSYSDSQGSILQWQGGGLYGSNFGHSYPMLMHQQGAEIYAQQRYGNFTFDVGLSVNKYAFPVDTRLDGMGMNSRQNQYGISGAINYKFNSNLSTTLYGRYVSNPFYYSMAAFPFIRTSQYGGYLTLRNENTSLDLGVNRHYDPFARRWISDPIVRPTFKIGNIKMDVDVGPLLKDMVNDIFNKHRSRGPIIMPRM